MKQSKNSYIATGLICLSIALTPTAHAQWVTQVSGTSSITLNAVSVTDANTAYVAGDQAFGIRTNNTGNDWVPMNTDVSGFALDINGILFISPTAGFTIGDVQEVLYTTNGGSTWAAYSSGMTDLYDLSVAYAVGSDLWVCGDIEAGYGFLLNQSTFALSQPAAAQNKALRGICFITANTGYVVGDEGLILKTTDNGVSWTSQNSGVDHQLNKVKFISANEGIAVGNNGTILRTTDGGANWQLTSNLGTENFNNVYYGSNNDVWVIGDGGSIMYSNNGGNTWTFELSGTSENLYGISGFGSASIWVCGAAGTLLYYGNSAPPECEMPSAISASNITATAATLSWSEVAGAAGYEYALTATPDPPASVTASADTVVSIDTLSSNTDYYFHIRTSCGDATYSGWMMHGFTTENITGIEDLNNKSLQLYPNPSQGIFFISGIPRADMSIYDCMGRLVRKNVITEEKKQIDLSGFPKGVYHIRMIMPNGNAISKRLLLE